MNTTSLTQNKVTMSHGKPLMLPINIKLLDTSGNTFSKMRPTTSLDIFDGATSNLHPDGLFSTLTFGLVGTPERFTKFSYVNIGVSILHPKIFKDIVRIKSLYADIISGRSYAVWNEKEKQFDLSDVLSGQTGYNFFMSKVDSIVLKRTKSDARNVKIEVFEKAVKAKTHTLNKIVIIPAGLRDIQTDEAGRITQDEINALYRKLIAISKTVTITDGTANTGFNDTIRWNIQRTFNEIYDMLYTIINGKKGFIQGKWASRKIFNGTRNVLSNLDVSTNKFEVADYVGVQDTICGLYQAMMGQPGITIFQLRSNCLDELFGGGMDNVQLINKKTLKTEYVQVDSDTYDKWYTGEGLFKTIGMFGDSKLRHKPVIINGHYLQLLYRDSNGYLPLNSIDDLPEGFDPELVKPMTYVEFYYIACYRRFKTSVATATRYPITGMGSIYATHIHVKSTIIGVELNIYNKDGTLSTDESSFTREFPKTDGVFLDTMIVSPVRLVALGADFDGDKLSLNFAESKEAIAEVHKLLGEMKSYLSPLGGLQLSAAGSDMTTWVTHNLLVTNPDKTSLTSK